MHKTLLLGLLALGLAPLFALACSSSGADSFTGNPNCSVSGTGCKTACDSTLGCVECAGNGDCGAAAPICVAGRCRTCGTTSDCATGQACYPATHTCAPACTGVASCSNDDRWRASTESTRVHPWSGSMGSGGGGSFNTRPVLARWRALTSCSRTQRFECSGGQALRSAFVFRVDEVGANPLNLVQDVLLSSQANGHD